MPSNILNKGTILAKISWNQAKDKISHNEGTIKFSVSDSGCGIPKEKKKNLFSFLDAQNYNEDLQDTNSMQNSTKLAGTGLGISQKIAKSLGTKIDFTSDPSSGSVFWIKFKVSNPTQKQIYQLSQYCTLNDDLLSDEEHMQIRNSKENATLEAECQKITMTAIHRNRSLEYEDEIVALESVKNNKIDKKDDCINQIWDQSNLDNLKNLMVQNTSNYSPESKNISNEEKATKQSFDDLSVGSEDHVNNIGRSIIKKTTDFQSQLFETEKKIHGWSISIPDSVNSSDESTCKLQYENDSGEETKHRTIKKDKFGKIKGLDQHREYTMPDTDNPNLFNKFNKGQIHNKFKKDCLCPSVLIVDDQYINRFIINQYWKKYDIPWSEAEDGLVAVNLVKKESKNVWWNGYELILMDLNMPILGGIEATQQIMELKWKEEINKNIKVVAVTAFPSKSEKARCIEVGITDFIVKPFTLSHFLSLVSY